MDVIKVVINRKAGGIAGETQCHKLRIDVSLLRISATKNNELPAVAVLFGDE